MLESPIVAHVDVEAEVHVRFQLRMSLLAASKRLLSQWHADVTRHALDVMHARWQVDVGDGRGGDEGEELVQVGVDGQKAGQRIGLDWYIELQTHSEGPLTRGEVREHGRRR